MAAATSMESRRLPPTTRTADELTRRHQCASCGLDAFASQTACVYCSGAIVEAPRPVPTRVSYRCSQCDLRTNRTAVMCVVCSGVVVKVTEPITRFPPAPVPKSRKRRAGNAAGRTPTMPVLGGQSAPRLDAAGSGEVNAFSVMPSKFDMLRKNYIAAGHEHLMRLLEAEMSKEQHRAKQWLEASPMLKDTLRRRFVEEREGFQHKFKAVQDSMNRKAARALRQRARQLRRGGADEEAWAREAERRVEFNGASFSEGFDKKPWRVQRRQKPGRRRRRGPPMSASVPALPHVTLREMGVVRTSGSFSGDALRAADGPGDPLLATGGRTMLHNLQLSPLRGGTPIDDHGGGDGSSDGTLSGDEEFGFAESGVLGQGSTFESLSITRPEEGLHGAQRERDVANRAFDAGYKFNSGLARQRRPQNVREFAEVCNQMDADQPRLDRLRDEVLARRRRLSKALRDRGLVPGSDEHTALLNQRSVFSDVGQSRPGLPSDISAVHADVSWVRVPEHDGDVARTWERQRLVASLHGPDVEASIVGTVDGPDGSSRSVRFTQSMPDSGAYYDAATGKRRRRAKRKGRRGKGRRGLRPGAVPSAAPHSAKRSALTGTYAFMARSSAASRKKGLHGMVAFSRWQEDGLGVAGGGAFWGDRSASAGRPSSRGTTYRANTRPPSPEVGSLVGDDDRHDDGSPHVHVHFAGASDGEDMDADAQAMLQHIDSPAHLRSSSSFVFHVKPNTVPDLTYWQFLGGKGGTATATKLARAIASRSRTSSMGSQMSRRSGSASPSRTPRMGPTAADKVSQTLLKGLRPRWFGYGRYQDPTAFRITSASAIRLITSSPVRPEARGDWAQVAQRVGVAANSLAGATDATKQAAMFAASTLAEGNTIVRGKPPADTGIMYRTTVRLRAPRPHAHPDRHRTPRASPVPLQGRTTSTTAPWLGVVALSATHKPSARHAPATNQAKDKPLVTGDGISIKAYLPTNSSATLVTLIDAELTYFGGMDTSSGWLRPWQVLPESRVMAEYWRGMFKPVLQHLQVTPEGRMRLDRSVYHDAECKLREYENQHGPNDIETILADKPPVTRRVTHVTCGVARVPVDKVRRKNMARARSLEMETIMRAQQSSRRIKPKGVGATSGKNGGGDDLERTGSSTRTGSSQLLDLVEEEQEEHPLWDMVLCFSAKYAPEAGDVTDPVKLRTTVYEADASKYLNGRPRAVCVRRGAAEMGRRLASKLTLRRVGGWPWLPAPLRHPEMLAAAAHVCNDLLVAAQRPADLVPDPVAPPGFEHLPVGRMWGAPDPLVPTDMMFLTLPSERVPEVPRVPDAGEYKGVVYEVNLTDHEGKPAGPGWAASWLEVHIRWGQPSTGEGHDQPSMDVSVGSSAQQTISASLDSGDTEALLCSIARSVWEDEGHAPPEELDIESPLLWLSKDEGAADTIAGELVDCVAVSRGDGDAWVLTIDGGGEE